MEWRVSDTTLWARRDEWIAGANLHDSLLLEPTLAAVVDTGLVSDIETLHLDRRNTDRKPASRHAALNLATTILITAKLTDWKNRWNPTQPAYPLSL